MSAPVVTGVIALWLQANPRLTPKDCLDIFARTCVRPDHSLTYPNNYYGYGEIDAAAGIEAAIAMTGIKNLEVTQRTGQLTCIHPRRPLRRQQPDRTA